jgi:beta-N-acetylhexosaminidase
VAAAEGFREAGVLPVLKHFPGHGDTGADSHHELPVQPAERSRLDRVELVPFRAALAAGAPAVMTTHILFPALDPELPATLSRPILTGLLREELGFDGLVCTDCLEMRGIADHWGPEEAAVLALRAGADVLLVCHTRETQVRMRDALCRAVREGRLSEDRIGESVRRVGRVRELTAGVREQPPNPGLVSAERYRELEARVSEASLRLLPGSRTLEGWTRADPVVVSGAAWPARALAGTLAARGWTARPLPWDETLAARIADPGTQLVWMALPDEPFPGGRPAEAAARLLADHPRRLVVAAREPYCLDRYPAQVPRLAAWGSQPPHLEALARWLGRRAYG